MQGEHSAPSPLRSDYRCIGFPTQHICDVADDGMGDALASPLVKLLCTVYQR